MTAVAIHPGWVRTEMNKGTGMLEPRDSAEAVKRVCDGLTSANAGYFLDWQGQRMEW